MPKRTIWDERFSGEHYLYGTEPNDFLARHAHLLRGPVLSLAEGEGRNAVFLASRGLRVLGVDSSATGLEKARRLAHARGVTIETQQVDLASYRPPAQRFAAIVSIFAHLPSSIRARLCPLLEQALLPNGILLLEAYSEDQLQRDTGGPDDIDMLLSVDKLRAEFPRLQPLLLQEVVRDVIEGEGHTGQASVVQFIASRQP